MFFSKSNPVFERRTSISKEDETKDPLKQRALISFTAKTQKNNQQHICKHLFGPHALLHIPDRLEYCKKHFFIIKSTVILKWF